MDQMSVLEIAGSASDAGDANATVTLKSGVTPSGRQSRARGATPRELADTLAKLLGGGSVLLAMWIDVEEAAMLPTEADAVAEPLARIINRSAWGKQLAKRLIGADDYIALSVALFSYGVRIYPLIQAKASEVQRAKPIRPSAPVRQQPPAQPAKPEQPKPAGTAGPAGPSSDLNGSNKFSPDSFSGLSAGWVAN